MYSIPIGEGEAARLKEVAVTLSTPEDLRNICHMRWHGEPLPSDEAVCQIVDLSRALLFPGFFGESDIMRDNIGYHVGLGIERLRALLVDQITAGLCFGYECDVKLHLDEIRESARVKALAIIERLPELRRMLEDDAMSLYRSDPAAPSLEEVLYCYPGLRATASYRLAHEILLQGVPIIPRMISEMAHRETGADIHPAATIGERFTLDHCTGVVIGATCIIGDDVNIYQGVTLGAKSFVTDENNLPVKGHPRHPIIGNRVTIYANATILGRVTIGDDAIIGVNVWVTTDVAAGERVIQAPLLSEALRIGPKKKV